MNPALNGASLNCSPSVLLAPGDPPLWMDQCFVLHSSLRCHCCTRVAGAANLVATPVAIRATLLALLLVTALLKAAVVAAAGLETATGLEATARTAGSALGSTVDLDGATLELLLVQVVDGVLSTGIVGKGDEAETAGAASLAITDNNGILDFTEMRETMTKGFVAGVPGQATDEQLGRPEMYGIMGMSGCC